MSEEVQRMSKDVGSVRGKYERCETMHTCGENVRNMKCYNFKLWVLLDPLLSELFLLQALSKDFLWT